MNNPNPHARVATERLTETPRPRTSLDGQLHFGFDALTQAVLALADEIRTANLINYPYSDDTEVAKRLGQIGREQ